ncbi:MAG: PIN domain-containing protein [Methylococcaceae bacterium]|nr:MAG: PIN domain-containing protein [Methylococcaceae bacterium]
MIGLDTNVIVRYLVQDDPRQSLLATEFIEQSLSIEQTGFISLVTLAEVVWVLGECYGATKARIVQIVDSLLVTKQVTVEHASAVHRAIRVYRSSGADFGDALILQVCMAEGCNKVVTFDRKADKVEGFEILR